MFGLQMLDAWDDDPRWSRWRSALAGYRQTGDWPHEPWDHLLPIPDGVDLPPYVWTVRGDEVWRWQDGSWAVADPQPARSFAVLDGTGCAESGRHSLVSLSTAHYICELCGSVAQTIPDGMTREAFARLQFTYSPTPTTGD
ncbi:MAG: hypothetical protein ACKV2O_01600 [Acidimicrobiales bacterium]